MKITEVEQKGDARSGFSLWFTTDRGTFCLVQQRYPILYAGFVCVDWPSPFEAAEESQLHPEQYHPRIVRKTVRDVVVVEIARRWAVGDYRDGKRIVIPAYEEAYHAKWQYTPDRGLYRHGEAEFDLTV